MSLPKFGDLVQYDIGDGRRGAAFVIGTLHYARKGDVIMLADEKAFGMPIARAHCQTVSGGHNENCEQWRERYLSRFGRHWLLPEKHLE